MDSMQEMVHNVGQKAGIAEHQAEKAVHAVLDFIMARLPEPMASQVKHQVMSGGAQAQMGQMGSQVEQMSASMGGPMGDIGKQAGGTMQDLSKGMGGLPGKSE